MCFRYLQPSDCFAALEMLCLSRPRNLFDLSTWRFLARLLSHSIETKTPSSILALVYRKRCIPDLRNALHANLFHRPLKTTTRPSLRPTLLHSRSSLLLVTVSVKDHPSSPNINTSHSFKPPQPSKMRISYQVLATAALAVPFASAASLDDLPACAVSLSIPCKAKKPS